MHIDLKVFLNLLSYDGIINPIHLPSEIAAEVELEQQAVAVANRVCHCEPVNELQTDCWYPIQSWYDEVRRRNKIDATLQDCEHDKIITSPEELNAALIIASVAGDVKEVNRLISMIKKV